MSALTKTIEGISNLLKPSAADQEKRSSAVRYLAWRFFLYALSMATPLSLSPEHIRDFCLAQCEVDLDRLQEKIDQESQAQLQECIDLIETTPIEPLEAAGDITYFYNSLLTLLAEARPKSGLFATPVPVARFIGDLLKPGENEVVYDPAAGVCGLLIEVSAKSGRQGRTLGHEIDPDVAMLGAMNLALHGVDITGLHCQDTLQTEVAPSSKQLSLFFEDEPEPPPPMEPAEASIDVILTHLPFYKHELASFPYGKRELDLDYDSAFLQHCMERLKKDGKSRCAIIVERSVLEQKTRDRPVLRERLFRDFTIQMIIRLPPQTFGPASNKETFLLCFSSGQKRAKQETLRYDLPLKKGPPKEEDFAPVLSIWPRWSAYLTEETKERPEFEQSEHLWVEAYEDLQQEKHLVGYQEQPENSYCLIRQRPRTHSAPVDPVLLVEQILEQTEKIRQAALQWRQLLNQRERQV